MNVKTLNNSTEIIKAPVEQTGEIKLLQAIIIQALHDLAREKENKKCVKNGKMARDWLLSSRTDEFSFRWCVEHGLQGYDAAAIVSNIQSIVRRGNYDVWRRLFRRSGVSEFSIKKS